MSGSFLHRAGRPGCWVRAVALVIVLLAGDVLAQAPAASAGATPSLNAEQLDKLVGPIALYPDDLIAIILPAATYPLEIVQADRFLDKRKSDKNLKVNETWHDAVKSLLNYPEVVKKMSADLDWTSSLGEAVVTDQAAVLRAVQTFRHKVNAAGNLKSDDKQKVVVQKEVIEIVQANPEVIYVPQYNPATIVVAGGYPSYAYYPAPYPVYYYPYPPGAAFATGLVWGAAIGAAWNGGHYQPYYGPGGNNSINVSRNVTVNGDVTINGGRSPNQPPPPPQGQSNAWKPDRKPGEVSGVPRPTAAPRAGDASAPGAPLAAQSGQARPAAGQAGQAKRAGQTAPTGPAAKSTPTAQPAGRDGEAFGGYGSGRDARADSSRGAASREAMGSSGGGQSRLGGGGRGAGGRGARRL